MSINVGNLYWIEWPIFLFEQEATTHTSDGRASHLAVSEWPSSSAAHGLPLPPRVAVLFRQRVALGYNFETV